MVPNQPSNGADDLTELLRQVCPELPPELAAMLRRQPPEMPPVPEGDLRDAVSTLANAAYLFRGVFLQLANGTALDDVFEERAPYLIMADKVVNKWCEHLGLNDD